MDSSAHDPRLDPPPANTPGRTRRPVAAGEACGVDAESTGERLRQATGATQVIVTRGERGAQVALSTGTVKDHPASAGPVVDTVGAGDAFSSVWIVGLARGWSMESILRRALDSAAKACSIRGATTTDATLYRKTMAPWVLTGV